MVRRAILALSVLLMAGATHARAQTPSEDPLVAPPPPQADAQTASTGELPPPPAPPPPPPAVSPTSLPPGYSSDLNATSTMSVEEELVAAAVTVEAAPEATQEAGPTHRGFFVRPHVGVGYLGATGPNASLKGLALGAGLKVGAAIIDNLILFGQFMFQAVNGGAYDGTSLPAPDEATGLDMVLFGGGMAYYFMPLNLHIALGGSVTAFQMHVGTRTILNDPTGFGLNATVGKEWWLGGSWGLGIAAELLLGFADEYSLFGVSLNATLTYN